MVVADDGSLLAASDGGDAPQVVHLDADCSATGVTTADVDPYDVEDLARGPGGTLWLADTGDNTRVRETVAVFVLDSLDTGTTGATLHRLTYPDGPHDAEALLVDRSGRPFVVTKELSGVAGVYAPTGPLATPGPTPMRRVATLTVPATDTPGGPVGGFGSVLVTGAATSPDGTAVALRTYTDAYVFDAQDGDVVAALGRTPLRVPLPDEPQGEAIALTADGSLLSAGEQRAAPSEPPVRVVPGVVAALRAQGLTTASPAPPAGAGPSAAADQPGEATPPAPAAGVSSRVVAAGLVAAAAAVGAGVLLVRRRRRQGGR